MTNHKILPPGPGRPKGLINQTTRVHQQFWQCILDGQAEYIESALADLYEEDKAQFLKIILSMSEFCMPKLARTELTGTDGGKIKVSLNLNPDK